MKYSVGGTMIISMHIEVEADSPAEARKKARQAGVMSLCWQCSGNHQNQWSTSGELDGEVTIRRNDIIEVEM